MLERFKRDASQEPSPEDKLKEAWRGQILARERGEGTVVGDETMEAFAASLGIDETSSAGLYVQVKHDLLAELNKPLI